MSLSDTRKLQLGQNKAACVALKFGIRTNVAKRVICFPGSWRKNKRLSALIHFVNNIITVKTQFILPNITIKKMPIVTQQ